MTAPTARTSALTSASIDLPVVCAERLADFPRTQSLRPAHINQTLIPFTVLYRSYLYIPAFSDTPKSAAATSSLMPDQPPSSDTTEYESTLDDIIKQVERSVHRSEAELFVSTHSSDSDFVSW